MAVLAPFLIGAAEEEGLSGWEGLDLGQEGLGPCLEMEAGLSASADQEGRSAVLLVLLPEVRPAEALQALVVASAAAGIGPEVREVLVAVLEAEAGPPAPAADLEGCPWVRRPFAVADPEGCPCVAAAPEEGAAGGRPVPRPCLVYLVAAVEPCRDLPSFVLAADHQVPPCLDFAGVLPSCSGRLGSALAPGPQAGAAAVLSRPSAARPWGLLLGRPSALVRDRPWGHRGRDRARRSSSGHRGLFPSAVRVHVRPCPCPCPCADPCRLYQDRRRGRLPWDLRGHPSGRPLARPSVRRGRPWDRRLVPGRRSLCRALPCLVRPFPAGEASTRGRSVHPRPWDRLGRVLRGLPCPWVRGRLDLLAPVHQVGRYFGAAAGAARRSSCLLSRAALSFVSLVSLTSIGRWCEESVWVVRRAVSPVRSVSRYESNRWVVTRYRRSFVRQLSLAR